MTRAPQSPTTYPACYTQIERHLRNYPLWVAFLRELDKYAEALCCSVGSDQGRVQGGESRPIQERVMAKKEGWSRYRRLAANCDYLERALEAIGEERRRFVAAYWWEDHRGETGDGELLTHAQGVGCYLGISESTVWRWRRSVLEDMEPLLREVDPTVLTLASSLIPTDYG